MRSFAIFLIAVVDTVILTSIVSTQLVLADVTSFGLTVSLGERLQTTFRDLLGVGVPLLLLIGLSFSIAFFIARYAIRKIGGSPTIWYTAAGLSSLPVGIIVIKYFMGGTLLASARTTLGMALIAACSMVGGWVYAYLLAKYGKRETVDA